MVLGLVAIVARLALLQVKDASAYQALARDQRVRTIELPPARGTMFDRNGQELAMSLPAKAVFADPALVEDADGEASKVAQALGLSEDQVLKALTGSGRFQYLARGVDLSKAGGLQAQHLPGIGFLDESRRYFPAGALAPQVLGFVGLDGRGLAGLELQFQSLLAGRPGSETLEEDPSGTDIPQGANVDVPPVPGDDLILTIDKQIQYRAQIALAAAVKANHAKGGTVIVMDPRTGEILAMTSYPLFDPNNFRAADPESVRNRAVTDAYEPGSVNKVITASAALQEGAVKVTQRFSIPDHYQMYSKTFTDSHPHPTEEMTLGDIIAYSSNIGAITVAHLLGQARLYSYLQRFGLTSRTGIEFPGESSGILPPPSQWSGTSMGTIPIGQGIAVTPLQMLSVYATIANGGVWMQPRLVRGTVDQDGKFEPARPSVSRVVVSPGVARSVTRMLAYAVDVGTGTQAQIPGFWVAGKTGTARKVNAAGTGYTDKYVASFIGFTPAARPQLAILAVLDEPVTVFGGIASAPLFQDVARYALARLRIPPAAKLPVPPHAIPAS
jgi:cell division protein FtsI (penicillin-binding protein 3)